MTSEIRANTIKNRVGLGTVSFTNTGPIVSGIITATNVNVGNDLDVTDDLTIGGEFNMQGTFDNNKYIDARIGSSNSLIFRSSSGGAGNLVTMLQLGVSGTSLVGNFALGDSSDSSSAAGPEFTLNRNSSSPANADYLGQIKFAGRSSTGVQRNYAKITGKILDVTNGSEDGILEFAHIKAGSQVITGRWRSDSLQLLNDTNLSVAGDTTLTGILEIDAASSTTEMIMLDVAGTNFAKIGHNSSSGVAVLDVRSEGHTRFLTGGNTERLRIASDGKLGVGDFSSTSISQALHVRGSQPSIYLEHTGGYDMTLTTNDGMGQNGITVNGGFLSLAYNNKNIVMCRTGGRVGIGTDDPQTSLHLYGGASGFRLERETSNPGYFNTTISHGTPTGATNYGSAYFTLSQTTGDYVWRSSTNERMRLKGDGKLGIGTDNPTDILDINSDSASAVTNMYLRNHANLGGAALNIWTQGTYSSPTYKAIIGCSDAGGTIRMGAASNHNLLLLVNNAPKVTIKTDGNVGIGTDNPGSLLTLDHATNPAIQFKDSGTKVASINAEGTQTNIASFQSKDLVFAASTSSAFTERLRIGSDGKVIISNSNPPSTGAMTLITDDGSATTLGTAATLRVANDGGSANYSVFEAESSSGSIRLANDGRFIVTGRVQIGANNSAFGQLCLNIPSQAGGAALQVMNTNAGSGDNTLTNIVLRSVNNSGSNWAHAEYRASSHIFAYQGTQKFTVNSNGAGVSGFITASYFKSSGPGGGQGIRLEGLAAGSGSNAVDTGISVNQGNASATMLVIGSRNTSDQQHVQGYAWLLRFAYNGDHLPAVHNITGNSAFWSISKSGSNTLQINGNSGNWQFGGIWVT